MSRRSRVRFAPGRFDALEPRVVLATFLVTSPDDGGPGSLRDAIEQANRDPQEEHTIEFAPSAGDAITLVDPLPVIAVDLTIEGPEGDPVTIARDTSPEAEEFRLITIAEGATVRLQHLVLTGGRADFGGAIYNEGTLALEYSSVVGNQARFKGGGLYNRGGFWTFFARIEGNEVEGAATIGFGPAGIGRGGGIYNDGQGSMNSSILANNRANREGGGLFNEGTFTIQATTVSGNVAEGFVLAGGLVPFGRGGGISNAHSITINAATIVENRANRVGGGIFSNVIRGGSNNINPFRVEDSVITSSIVADNPGGNLVVKAGTFLSGGHNLFDEPPEVAAQPSDLIGVDPLLGPPGDHGGDFLSYPLLPGSPAIDAGFRDPDYTLDQRGFIRPEGQADIGAFESKGFTLGVVSGSEQSAPPGSAFGQPLVVAVSSPAEEPVAGGLVTFTAPASGPSATLSRSTAVIDPSGLARTGALAGSEPGSYAVEATAGAGSLATFELTNEGTPASADSAVGEPAPAASTQRPSPYRAASPPPSTADLPTRWAAIASRWGRPNLADRLALLSLLRSRRLPG